MFLLKMFGSKKLIAAFTAVVAFVAVPVLNAKFGLGLDTVQFAGVLAGIGGVVLAYIAAQYRIDMATEGDTTTSAMLTRVAAGAAGPVPPSVVAALTVAVSVLPAGPGRDAALAALAEVNDTP